VLPPVLPEGHHAGVLEPPQLLRNGRLGHPRAVDEVIDRPLPVSKSLEQVSSGRIREELEYVGHRRNMSLKIYIDAGM